MGAAWRYLTAEVRRRPNLTIMGEAQAERIVFDGRRAVGVRCAVAASRSTCARAR